MTNLIVSFPPGAGGGWLSRVVEQCATGLGWQDNDIDNTVNFHLTDDIIRDLNQIVFSCHDTPPADNVISIGNDNCRYNFWRLYCYKRILYELKYKRYNKKRLVISPYNNFVPGEERNEFFWLVNQCRYIQSYQYTGKFNVSWILLFTDPKQAWNVIIEYLLTNKIENRIDFDIFLEKLQKYKNTCTRIKYTFNFNHKLFLIWSIALLQNQNIIYYGDVFKDFGNKHFAEWINQHRDLIIEYTMQQNWLLHNYR